MSERGFCLLFVVIVMGLVRAGLVRG